MNPDVQEAKARIIPSPTRAAALAAQRPARAPPLPPPGGLVERLAAVLAAQVVPPGMRYQAALCAPGAVHYGAEPYDAG